MIPQNYFLPGIRIRSPRHSSNKAGTFPAPSSPTLNAVHGGPKGAAIVGSTYCVPASDAEPHGWSGHICFENVKM